MNHHQLRTAAWEGLGGPLQVEDGHLERAVVGDCCADREMKDMRRCKALRNALHHYDVVAGREKRHQSVQRQLCRCRHNNDTNTGGDDDTQYRALMELRQMVAGGEYQEDNTFVYSYSLREEMKSNSFEHVIEADEKEEEEEDDEFDYLLDEDIPGLGDEIRAIEERRRKELENEALQRQLLIQQGYGTHRQMKPFLVFAESGLQPGMKDFPAAVVLHLYDPDSIASASLDLFLEKIAKQSPGTKFLRTEGRALLEMDVSSKVLPRLKPGSDIPALVAIRDGIAVNVCPRLQGLVDNNTGQIIPDVAHEWLMRCGVLIESTPRIEVSSLVMQSCYLCSEPEVEPDMAAGGKFYECGMDGCAKDFPHAHIGLQTDYQEGLIISKEEILSG